MIFIGESLIDGTDILMVGEDDFLRETPPLPHDLRYVVNYDNKFVTATGDVRIIA